MLCPNAFSWSKGLKKNTHSGSCWTIAAVTAVIYSICRVPYILNEEAQRWCSNTMTKCSCFYKSPVLCVQDMQSLHGGKRGRKDISFVYWAICHVGQSYFLWFFLGWFCSFLIEKIKSLIAQVSFSWLIKLEKKICKRERQLFFMFSKTKVTHPQDLKVIGTNTTQSM